MIGKKLTIEEVDSQLEIYGIERVGEYKGARYSIPCIDKEGYSVYPLLSHLKEGKKPRIVHSRNPDSMSNISRWILLKKKSIVLEENQKYISANINLNVNCKKCGEKYNISWSNLNGGKGCPYCSSQKINLSNCFAAKRPDLVRYFESPEISYFIALYSDKKINLICPDCGYKRMTTAHRLSTSGFFCESCGDGVSMPEKFIRNLLGCLAIDFKSQYSPMWAEGKRYDFYIEALNLIIETHGEQHYVESFIFTKKCMTLKERQTNDEFKEIVAKNSGLEYATIDCRRSTLEWLMKNTIAQLGSYFDLSEIKWMEIYANSQNSLCVEAWKLWNEGYRSPVEISKKLKISKDTIITYLKHGAEIKKVDYDTREQMRKSAYANHNKVKKPINQYSLSGKFIKKWSSAREIYNQLGIHYNSISLCALGKGKTAGKFIWEFAND